MARKTKLIGDKKLKRKLKKHSKATNKQTKAAIRTGAFLIENEAVRLVPRVTTNLARSIHTEIEERMRSIEALIGTNEEYGPDVEFGTKPHRIDSPVLIKGVGWRKIGMHPGTEAQPFLRPAFDTKKDDALREVEDTLDDLVKKFNR